MDDRKLHALLTTLRTGSFSKAALELNCTQSAVTQMMNALENELGCQILARDHRGVKLTPAGEELFPLIKEAEASLSRLLHQARKVAENTSVTLRIGSFSSIANTWLPQVLQAYQARHPNLTFDIRIGTNAIINWLLEGKIDLALGDADRCQSFQWYPLMDDPYCAVLPASFIQGDRKTISQDEFAEYPLIMSPMNVLDAHLSVLADRRLNVSCDDDSTILAIVAQGLGVTAMPRLSLRNIPESVKALELEPVPKRILGVALPKSPSKEAVALASYLRKQYPYE